MFQPDIRKIKALAIQVCPHGNVFNLAGPHNAATRQTLLALLTGTKRPKAQSGIHALMDAFYAVANIPEDTISRREKMLAAWLKDATPAPKAPAMAPWKSRLIHHSDSE